MRLFCDCPPGDVALGPSAVLPPVLFRTRKRLHRFSETSREKDDRLVRNLVVGEPAAKTADAALKGVTAGDEERGYRRIPSRTSMVLGEPLARPKKLPRPGNLWVILG